MNSASSLTPVILTFNEEANLARTLASLNWADRVVVLDSGSTDDTRAIAARFSNTAFFTRRFDNHKAQWTHALTETGVDTEYGLALDADMAVSSEFPDEFRTEFLASGCPAAMVPFEYRIDGTPLMGSMLRPQLRLFRMKDVQIIQEGHTQKFHAAGSLYSFKAPLLHDDRKPLERWVSSQLNYSRLERQRLLDENPSGLRPALRKLGLMPVVAGLYSYARAGGPLRGDAAMRYAWERVVFECLLSMRLIESRTQRDGETSPSPRASGSP